MILVGYRKPTPPVFRLILWRLKVIWWPRCFWSRTPIFLNQSTLAKRSIRATENSIGKLSRPRQNDTEFYSNSPTKCTGWKNYRLRTQRNLKKGSRQYRTALLLDKRRLETLVHDCNVEFYRAYKITWLSTLAMWRKQCGTSPRMKDYFYRFPERCQSRWNGCCHWPENSLNFKHALNHVLRPCIFSKILPRYHCNCEFESADSEFMRYYGCQSDFIFVAGYLAKPTQTASENISLTTRYPIFAATNQRTNLMLNEEPSLSSLNISNLWTVES